MEDKKIDALKNWLKPEPIRDVLIFLGFANFYYCFILGFNKTIALFTSMLEISPILVT